MSDEHLTLGELIEHLSREPQDRTVTNGFGAAFSYRGFYDQVAFPPIGRTTVAELFAAARVARGSVYTGYKGGDYRMSSETPVWIAKWGETVDAGLSLDALRHDILGYDRLGYDRPNGADHPPLGYTLLNVEAEEADPVGSLRYDTKAEKWLPNEGFIRFGSYDRTVAVPEGRSVMLIDSIEKRIAALEALAHEPRRDIPPDDIQALSFRISKLEAKADPDPVLTAFAASLVKCGYSGQDMVGDDTPLEEMPEAKAELDDPMPLARTNLHELELLADKYTFRTVPGDYRIHIDRYEERDWLVVEKGSKALLALMHELNYAMEEITKLRHPKGSSSPARPTLQVGSLGGRIVYAEETLLEELKDLSARADPNQNYRRLVAALVEYFEKHPNVVRGRHGA